MKVYKGRTRDQQREFNRQRREEYKRKKEAAIDSTSEEFELEVQTEEVPIEQISLKDRLLSRLNLSGEGEEEEEVKTKQEQKHIENSGKLLSSVLPLTLSALLAMYSKKLFSEEYQECAPTKQEVSAILLPIFSVIARHVSIEGKASQDAIDIAASLLASITLGMRMLSTAEEIKRIQNGQAGNVSPIRRDTRSNSIRQSEAVSRASSNTDESASLNGKRTRDASSNGSGYADGNDKQGREWEAEKVSQLLKRDTIGRRQMGLAPRSI